MTKSTEAQRLALRNRLVAVLGEPETEVLMDSFPPFDFDRLATRDEIDVRFALVDARFEQIDARFEQVDARFEQVDARFDRMEARFDAIDARFAQVDARFVALEASLRAELKTDLASMQRMLVTGQLASVVAVVGLVLGFG